MKYFFFVIGGRMNELIGRDGKVKVFGDLLFWEVSFGFWIYSWWIINCGK